jgi:flagellar FliL protein
LAKTKISENNEEKAGKNAKPKKKKTILIILVALVILAGSSAGAYIFFFKPAAQTGEVKKPKTEEKESLDLGEMIVNLSGSSAHYLRVKVIIDYPKDKKLAEELNKKKHIVSDVVISTLRSKTLAEVGNANAIQGLKKSLVDEINNNLDSGEITGIYFTDFLVQ